MARISAVLCMSHSPFLYVGPEEWGPAAAARRANGGISADTPVDAPEENAAKHARCTAAFAVLAGKLAEAKPDVLLIFGDDQLEQFDFQNFPALALFVGERFEGYRISPFFGLPVNRERARRPKSPEHWASVAGHPALARRLMVGLMERGFDLAFSTEVAKERGVGHAFMRPLEKLRPEGDLPVIPFSINCYYGPQPTARRCRQVGRAVREISDGLDDDLSVAVIGSGGLWHTPNEPHAYLDGGFDADILGALRKGDTARMAEVLDMRAPPFDPGDPEAVRRISAGTDMVLGLGNGSGETRNWIAAAATVDGVPGTVVDYVPINASPIGAGFAYWDLGRKT